MHVLNVSEGVLASFLVCALLQSDCLHIALFVLATYNKIPNGYGTVGPFPPPKSQVLSPK